MVIPESWHELKVYWEKLQDYVVVRRSIRGKELLFFVEPTREGWFHVCTIQELTKLLTLCDDKALSSFDFIALRQPTRKQRILCPVWGRAAFAFDLGNHRGRAIVIEAQTLRPYLWSSRSLDPEMSRELARLELDGHSITTNKRSIGISPTPESMRATILYRTLLHEIGHHVDYQGYKERADGCSAWDRRPKREREDFAHRYAHETASTLRRAGHIPFSAPATADTIRDDGLDPAWFMSA
ncbi:MAG: hypothetical protein REI94_02280 [Moraxellaceae bacterium]|nr:hypothetical protein [Moraxellaceae bacterium]